DGAGGDEETATATNQFGFRGRFGHRRLLAGTGGMRFSRFCWRTQPNKLGDVPRCGGKTKSERQVEMTETNGEVFAIRKGGKPITPENETSGVPSQSYYYGLTGEVWEPISPHRQRPQPRGRAPRRETEASASPESRMAFRCWWKNAQKAAESMELAASG